MTHNLGGNDDERQRSTPRSTSARDNRPLDNASSQAADWF